jgi:large subunit ribosomal protein L33
MAKNKDIRVSITLECVLCAQNKSKRFAGVSRYITQKNRRATPSRLELNKFCSRCGAHTVDKEIKK